MPKRLITIQETSEETGYSKGTLYRAARRGELPVVRFGGTLRVPAEWVDQLVSGALANFERDTLVENR